MQITKHLSLLLLATIGSFTEKSLAQNSDPSPPANLPPKAEDFGFQSAASPQYILRQGDVVVVKVYMEDDLTSTSRIGKDGAVSLPLLGSVQVASNSVERATTLIHDLLADGYLVKPQVTLNVVEFAKRRFTVLGQVQHPNTYDMPPEDSVSLLQAIAAAGGYTRIGNPRKITVQRTIGTENKVYKLDADAMSVEKKTKPFEILADDVIVVGEKWL